MRALPCAVHVNLVPVGYTLTPLSSRDATDAKTSQGRVDSQAKKPFSDEFH